MRRVVLLGISLSLLSARAMAQDPVKVDPQHYKVEVDNKQVRVLRVHYGPHEKSVMHSHPASVVISLGDQDAKFTLPGGKTTEQHFKAGEVRWADPVTHLPESAGDKPIDVILVELKGRTGGHKAAK